jgi:hypothetical protein
MLPSPLTRLSSSADVREGGREECCLRREDDDELDEREWLIVAL